MRVGVIGFGNMGQVHSRVLNVLHKTMGITVTAIAEPNSGLQQLAAEKWPQAMLYTDGCSLLEKEKIDAVHICVPNYLHTRLIEDALERGIHVFTEKPVCLYEAEGLRLLEAEKASRALAAVGQVVRFFKEYRYLKNIYHRNIYGSLKALRMTRLGGRPASWFLAGEKSGSVIMDLHIHDVDFMKSMLGLPDDFRTKNTNYHQGVVNQILAEFFYGSIPVTIEAFWDISTSFPFTANYHAYFERGSVVYDSRQEKSLTVYEEGGNVFHPDLPEEVPEEVANIAPYYKEIEAFYMKLSGKEGSEIVRLEDTVETLGILWKEQRRSF